jgi:hypothetical protein
MELAVEFSDPPATLRQSLDLLAALNASLRHDVPLPDGAPSGPPKRA